MDLLFTPSLINKALGTQRDVKLKTLAPPSSPPVLLESDKGGVGGGALTSTDARPADVYLHTGGQT